MKTTLIFTLFALIICANARTLNKRDVKDDLLAELDVYMKKAKAEIEKLDKDNQKNVADHLQADMDELMRLAKELKTATGTESIKLLTDQLTKLLGAFKARVDVLTEESISKERVLETAEKLISNGMEEVKKLMDSARIIEAGLLENDVNTLKRRVEALKSATDSLVIKGLSIDINLLSIRINTRLKLLGFEPSTALTTEATTPRITTVATKPPTTIPSRPPTTITTRPPSTLESRAPTTKLTSAPTTVPKATSKPPAPRIDLTTVPPSTTTFMCNTQPN